MKPSRTTLILAAGLALAGGFSAHAQSNNGTPGNADYAQFSQFITDRNIFDPNRYPHTRTGTTRTTRRTTRAHTPGAPYITFVGTMSYEKGLFAFFDSNSADTKKILVTDDEITGYTVKAITANAVTMTGPDKKQFQMKVGDQMRQEGGRWQLYGQNEAVTTAAPEAPAATSDTTTPAEAPAETPAAAETANLGGNDILKRLMEKRAKENQ